MTTTPTRAANSIRAVEDSRAMCFRQGKACVYASEEDGRINVTEAPDGVVEHLDTRTGQTTGFRPEGREPKRHWLPTTDSEADHRDWRQRGRQDHLVHAAPARVTGSLYNPDAIAQDLGDWNDAGNQREARRIVNAASAGTSNREMTSVSRAPIRDVRGPGSYAQQPRTGTTSGRCSSARTEPRSTSSACVNASGTAPDTTSRSRRSRGGGQQLRRTLPKRLRRSGPLTSSTTVTARRDTSRASRRTESACRRRRRPRGRGR